MRPIEPAVSAATMRTNRSEKTPVPFPRIGGHKSVAEFQQHLADLGLELSCDASVLTAAGGSPLAEPLRVGEHIVGNRWCVHPMEGWDGTPDGNPSDLTRRRWRNFGLSGAKLIWGGEAVAVQPAGRANPNQLCHRPGTQAAFGELLGELKSAHAGCGLDAGGLLVGLQLTHSGRFSRPSRSDRPEPRIAYRHPVLDARFGLDEAAVLDDGELRRLTDDYVAAARTAHAAGFDFVDIKACHGYLLHEFLSAYDRPGPYGGDLAGRSKLLRDVIAGVRSECPGLDVGVRLSVFDAAPYRPGEDRVGVPENPGGGYPGFGCDRDDPTVADLTQPIALIRQLRNEDGVTLWNLTAGSPYYNPHLQRPAYFPPSDGYQPPEDPLVGCVRQMQAVRDVKRAVPDIAVVGSAYTYLQDFLPHVAQALVREGWTDFVGLGRMILSDWTLPSDTLLGRPRNTKLVCRTFSDCTTAPRNGLVSGCFPLDPAYKAMDEATRLKQIKRKLRK